MKKNRRGFTLTEIVIGIAITAILGLAISKLMTSAQSQAASTRCRSMLRQNVQLASTYLEKDISSSRVKLNNSKKYEMTMTTGVSTSNPITKLEVPKDEISEDINYFKAEDTNDNLFDEVSYSINNGILMRNIKNGNSIRVAEHIKSIEFDTAETNNVRYTYSGKVKFKITAEARPEGQNEIASYSNELIVAVRQLENKINLNNNDNNDKHWKQKINKSDF